MPLSLDAKLCRNCGDFLDRDSLLGRCSNCIRKREEHTLWMNDRELMEKIINEMSKVLDMRITEGCYEYECIKRWKDMLGHKTVGAFEPPDEII